jgi:superoxide dismutase, Fe-Mn family
MQLSRRETLTAVLGGVAVGLVQRERVLAEPTPPATPAAGGMPPAYRGVNQVQPLPFDPGKLTGISEKLITSHHDNNYAGAVKRLNLIQQQIGALPKDAPPYQMGALKREELIATNSMILHELYFGNLGGSGKREGRIEPLLSAQYGTPEAWEAEFRLTGLALAGGSGWVVLSYDPHQRAVHTHWASDHTQNLAGGTPLLVMDMYEHAYQMDYGANAKAYVDAFFQNINWQAVNGRAERVLAAPA